MTRIVGQSFLVAVVLVGLCSLAGLLLLPAGISPALQLWLDGAMLLVAIWAAAAWMLMRAERIRRAHLALGQAHARLRAENRRLAEKACHDGMTGMLNREAFLAAVDETRSRADRGALLIVDADHFKTINDRFGHLAGDAALLEIAGAVTGALRSEDVIGRIGGEEFGVLLAGSGTADAREAAERLRRAVEQIRFAPSGGPLVPLTVSVGGTVCEPGEGLSALMRAADLCLYEAKNTGRNRVVLATGFEAAAAA